MHFEAEEPVPVSDENDVGESTMQRLAVRKDEAGPSGLDVLADEVTCSEVEEAAAQDEPEEMGLYIPEAVAARKKSQDESDWLEWNVSVSLEDDPELGPAIRTALAARDRPSVIDVVVTRDPARMMPGVDNRLLKVAKGDRPV